MDSPTSMFSVNDFVWAKLARYPPWPAVIIEPDPLAPTKHKNSYWVYFFGSHDYAWVEEKNIKPFEDYKDQFKATYKQASILEAIEELEEIIKKKAKNPKYQIEFIKYTRKDKKSSSRSRKSSESSVDTKRSLPLKERNRPVSRKRSRSSVSADSKYDRGRSSSRSIAGTNYDASQLIENDIAIAPHIFGFLAAHISAEGIIKNLIKNGHRLRVWSSSAEMCEELQEYAVRVHADFMICKTRRDLIRNSDIIYSYLTDPDQSKAFIEEFGAYDENDHLLDGKGYVEMTSIDPETSTELCKLIRNKGGTYIEAMLQGNRHEANKGELVILSAGKRMLFNECQSCFKAMGKHTFLLEKIGSATKIHMLLQVMRGVLLAGLAESFAIADKCGIVLEVMQMILNASSLNSIYLQNKADIIVGNKFADTEEAVQQIQKTLSQVQAMSNTVRQPLPLAANTHEIFKHARRLGYDNLDSACIYNRTRY